MFLLCFRVNDTMYCKHGKCSNIVLSDLCRLLTCYCYIWIRLSHDDVVSWCLYMTRYSVILEYGNGILESVSQSDNLEHMNWPFVVVLEGFINQHACYDDLLATFSLTNMHKSGRKHNLYFNIVWERGIHVWFGSRSIMFPFWLSC